MNNYIPLMDYTLVMRTPTAKNDGPLVLHDTKLASLMAEMTDGIPIPYNTVKWEVRAPNIRLDEPRGLVFTASICKRTMQQLRTYAGIYHQHFDEEWELYKDRQPGYHIMTRIIEAFSGGIKDFEFATNDYDKYKEFHATPQYDNW